MLIISSRDDFWESSDLSDFDEVRDVELNDDSLGVKLEKPELLTRLEERRILLLIHGYNNEEDDVVRAYNIIERSINSLVGDHYDLVVGYTWPGGDDGRDYFAAKNRASAVAPRAGRWFEDINTSCRSLDVMCHSMGARVALLALGGSGSRPVRNLFTMAAAVDNESIQVGEQYHQATQACEAAYVFHSKNDPVLKRAYRLAEWDNALGLTGPEDPSDILQQSPNVKVINSRRVITRHGAYKSSAPIYGFINSELTAPALGQYFTF